MVAKLAAIAAAAFMAGSAVGQQCLDEYRCIFHRWISDGNEWSWDLRPLCQSDQGYLALDNSNHSFWFQICGTTSKACYNPKSMTNAADNNEGLVAHGVVAQFWTDSTPGAQCYDPQDPTPAASKKPVPCTGECAVLATDVLSYNLVDVNNPATGGIIISHVGLPPTTKEEYTCPVDTNTGYPRDRNFTIVLQCDQSSKDANALTVLGVQEINDVYGNTLCQWVITAKSPSACASKGDPFDPYRDNPAHSFGFVVLGATLTVFVYFAYSFGDARGWFDPIKARMPAINIPFLSSGGSGFRGAAASSSSYKGISSATPITASAYGST